MQPGAQLPEQFRLRRRRQQYPPCLSCRLLLCPSCTVGLCSKTATSAVGPPPFLGTLPGGLCGHLMLLCLTDRHHSHTWDLPFGQISEQPSDARFQIQQISRPFSSDRHLPSGTRACPFELCLPPLSEDLTLPRAAGALPELSASPPDPPGLFDPRVGCPAAPVALVAPPALVAWPALDEGRSTPWPSSASCF